ncbi:unnamed protein product [Prorocentrum cordatum]|uniref:Uncharacterized protein n=1 Tax=Prorocentrum cordatum TaxID=2364126 RepID=A0ABN9WNV6_9DINO|nr:unnamed protein product [Polarella glacialis]
MQSSSSSSHAQLGHRLTQFVCLVNELQPFYEVLERNNLSAGTLEQLIRRCSFRTKDPEAFDDGWQPPPLTADGRFLSRFLVRNCGNYRREVPAAAGGEAVLSPGPVCEPAHAVLNRTQLAARAPRWVWDPAEYQTRRWERANIVQDIVGREKELGRFRTFTQGQPLVSMGAPAWRRPPPRLPSPQPAG